MTDKHKILIACHEPKEQKFRIPRGLDQEDKTRVEEYGTKCGVFHTKFVDGSSIMDL